MGIVRRDEQLPVPGSPEEQVLTEVYDFYSADGMKRKPGLRPLLKWFLSSSFLSRMASTAVAGLLEGLVMVELTLLAVSMSARDFLRRLLVVLGQAKCEAPTSSTSGKDIARTVARLRRGWIGCYVTTGTFSTHTQREVADDRYPLLLVPGGGGCPSNPDDGAERRGFGGGTFATHRCWVRRTSQGSRSLSGSGSVTSTSRKC